MDTAYACKPKGYFECERHEMLALVPGSALRLLDVGCGAGGFGGLFKAKVAGREVWGVEPNEEVAEEARSRLDHVIVGGFPQCSGIPRRYFDCCVFNDVLEHMVDPWAALSVARTYLRANGVVIASIPNVRHLTVIYRLVVRGEWTYTPSGVLDATHLRFFTRKSMSQMFERSGYEITEMRGLHPRQDWRVRILQLGCPWLVQDAKYIGYAVVARPRNEAATVGVAE